MPWRTILLRLLDTMPMLFDELIFWKRLPDSWNPEILVLLEPKLVLRKGAPR